MIVLWSLLLCCHKGVAVVAIPCVSVVLPHPSLSPWRLLLGSRFQTHGWSCGPKFHRSGRRPLLSEGLRVSAVGAEPTDVDRMPVGKVCADGTLPRGQAVPGDTVCPTQCTGGNRDSVSEDLRT